MQLAPIFEEAIMQRAVVVLPKERVIRREANRIYFFLLVQYVKARIGRLFGLKSEFTMS